MSRKDKRNLTPEQRKKIASDGAKAMWAKRKEALSHPKQAEQEVEPAAEVVESVPERRISRIKETPVLKVFTKALEAAQKELEKSLEEISYHEQMLAMKKARLPFLVQTIKALGGTINPEQVQGPSNPYYPINQGGEQMVPVSMPMAEGLPPVPRAQGGALGVIQETPKEDENMFLHEAEGGKWV